MSLTPEVQAVRHPDHVVSEQFLNRWSPRAFADKPVPDALLNQVLESARWAASSYNEQPWRFVVADTPARRDEFVKFLVPANQVWAGKAPVLIVSLAKQTFTHNGAPNRLAAHDVGAASAFMALAASEFGLVAHGMGGFDPELARATLGVPSDYEPMAVWALGYRGDTSQLPEGYQEREAPSDRHSLKKLVMHGKFQEPEGQSS